MVIPNEMAPPCKGEARDCFPGWSQYVDTLTTALAQPPALPRLIALHLGAEVIAGLRAPILVIDL